MKRITMNLGGVATLFVVVALVAPTARAQCPQARSFGGFPGGKAGSQVIVDASAFENLGNEFAQFWETGNAANGTGVGAAGSCDSQGSGVGWWQFVGTGTDRGIRGFVAQPGCVLPVCPGVGSGLAFLVEELTADGQGGGFIMYQSDETPAGARWYDHARTDPDAKAGSSMTHVMGALPTVTITGASGGGTAVVVTSDYSDVGSQFHGVEGAADTQLPGSAGIESYDVFSFQGGSPPDSLRSNWTLVHQVPYNDAAILSDRVRQLCPQGPYNPAFLAVGITFVGGVESLTVGPPSLPIPCEHIYAQPELPVRPPSFRKRRSHRGP